MITAACRVSAKVVIHSGFVKYAQFHLAHFERLCHPSKKKIGFPLDKRKEKLYNKVTEPRKYRKEIIGHEKLCCTEKRCSFHEHG